MVDKTAIIGLGNPGQEYSNTRHNLGFMVVDLLAKRENFPPWKKECRSRVSRAEWKGVLVFLAKPRTFMNLSGTAVLSLATKYKIPPGDLLVVVDDLALPPGKIRFRPGGGDGGHKGLSSIIQALGRNDFPRLRIGIGEPPQDVDPSVYVLSPILPEEYEIYEKSIERCVEGIKTYLTSGIEEAMNKYN